jgi:hypothetical protein
MTNQEYNSQLSPSYKKGMFTEIVTDVNQMEIAIIKELQVALRQYGYKFTSVKIEKL